VGAGSNEDDLTVILSEIVKASMTLQVFLITLESFVEWPDSVWDAFAPKPQTTNRKPQTPNRKTGDDGQGREHYQRHRVLGVPPPPSSSSLLYYSQA